MAIYGIGAFHENITDVSVQFVKKNLACVRWDIIDAPSLYVLLGTIKVGDIIYIKSAPIGQGIRVKAIGIVVNTTLVHDPGLGTGVIMKWIWQGNELIKISDDKYNVRNNTLYEEFDPIAQKEILERLFQKLTKI